jgi:hypothetical protein
VTTTLVLTIWVAASQLPAPSTAALARAASDLLGPDAVVRTETYPDAEPERVRPPSAGEASVEVEWSSPAHESVHLRLCRVADDCFERVLTFEPSDPDVERGRTLGLFVAAVFVERPRQPAAPPKLLPPAKLTRPTPAPAPPRGELTAAVTLAAPGTATGVGARLGAGYVWSSALIIEGTLEGRFGEVRAAEATSRLASFSLNALVSPWRVGGGLWPFMSGGIGLYQLSISHFSADDPAPDRKGRVLFGGFASAGIGLDLSAAARLYLESGAEILSGRTRITVHGQTRATWPYAAPVGRLGLKAFF